MKKQRLFPILAMLLFPPTSSMAALPPQGGSMGIARPYASGVKINGPWLGDADYDLSETKGGKASLNDEWRTLTGRVLYQRSRLDYQGSNFSVYTLMMEGFLEFYSRDEVVLRPYLSAGLSYATIDVEALGRDGDDEALVLQLGAGVGVQLLPAVMVDARYRYLHPFDRRLQVYGMPVGMDIAPHNLLIGMRFSF
jgi:opacity protein-like surface antigen